MLNNLRWSCGILPQLSFEILKLIDLLAHRLAFILQNRYTVSTLSLRYLCYTLSS